MGDLSFGKSFEMLVNEKETYVLTQLHTDMGAIGLFSHLTWVLPLFKRVPGLNADYLKFWAWISGEIETRIKVCCPSRFCQSGLENPLLIYCIEHTGPPRRVLLASRRIRAWSKVQAGSP